MPENLQSVRLDNGLSYQAAPEIAQYVEALRKDAKEAAEARDKAEARADAAEAKVAALEGEREQIRQDARAEAKARFDLEAQARDTGVEVRADQSDRDIRAAVITHLRGDAVDLTDRSDAYIEAAYDMAIAEADKRQSNTADTRQRMTQDSNAKPSGSMSAAAARAAMIAKMGA